jgi:hypothetical protein
VKEDVAKGNMPRIIPCAVEGREGKRERERATSCSSHAKLTGFKLTSYNIKEVL